MLRLNKIFFFKIICGYVKKLSQTKYLLECIYLFIKIMYLFECIFHAESKHGNDIWNFQNCWQNLTILTR